MLAWIMGRSGHRHAIRIIGSENDQHKRPMWAVLGGMTGKKRVGTTWLGALAAHAEEMRGHRRFLSKEVTQPKLSSWRPICQHCGAGQDRAGGVWRQQDSSMYHFPQWAVATCNSLTGCWLQM